MDCIYNSKLSTNLESIWYLTNSDASSCWLRRSWNQPMWLADNNMCIAASEHVYCCIRLPPQTSRKPAQSGMEWRLQDLRLVFGRESSSYCTGTKSKIEVLLMYEDIPARLQRQLEVSISSEKVHRITRCFVNRLCQNYLQHFCQNGYFAVFRIGLARRSTLLKYLYTYWFANIEHLYVHLPSI